MQRFFTEPDQKKNFYREDVRFPFALTTTGDLATVTGPENLRQAIQERIVTPLGEVEHRTEYGTRLDEEQGAPLGDARIAVTQAEILSQMQREKRLQDVAVFVETDDTDATAFVESTAKDGQFAGVAIQFR